MTNTSVVGVKVVIGIITAAVSFMGYGVINNQNLNVKSHTEMTADYVERDEKVLSVVTDIRIEQRSLIDSMKRIEAKL